jgi:hypothetical protein
MIYLIANALILIGIVLHLSFDRHPRSAHRTLEVILLYLLAVGVGVMGVMAFYGHAFRADETARYIGWAVGSPVQFEVAVANLSYGVMGLLCIWLRGNFWCATIVGYGVFLWGAAEGHLREIVVNANHAQGNAGAPLYIDIAMPLIFIALYLAYRMTRPAQNSHELSSSK